MQWVNIVRGTMESIVNATSQISRDKAFLRLLTLPHLFLPFAVPDRRILPHIVSGKAFAMTPPAPRPQHDAPTADQRLANTITRLAKDSKLRSAVRILQQDAKSDDTTFEQKIEQMQQKFPQATQPYTPTTQPHCTPCFHPEQVKRCVAKLSKQAATCIDGWTRQLIEQAIEIDPNIASLVGQICTWINDSAFGQFPMDCLRIGRGVAYPKKEGGVRPIVLSSTWIKLTGTLVMTRMGASTSDMQYAVCCTRGAERIVHKVRQQIQQGMAVAKIDISNAFNTASRHRISSLLQPNSDSKTYFDTFYGTTSQIVLYGPKGIHHMQPPLSCS